MKIYADRYPTAVRQVLTDLLVVAWVYVWIRAAMWLHDLVEKLAVPGSKLEGAGSGLADNLADAGGKVGRVPIVGDELTAPFDKAADAARALAEAGRDQQDLVGNLAAGARRDHAGLPDRPGAAGWLPLRVRWIRRASAAASLRRPRPGGTCWRCARWPPSRCASSTASARTWSTPGAGLTSPQWMPWPPWS